VPACLHRRRLSACYSEVLPDEGKETATAFLHRTLAWFAGHGVVVERVMTDNGNCYRSQMFRQACAGHGLRHLRTRPYTPRTNGKAERFIQTSLREWAYARPYVSSEQRSAALTTWLDQYNTTRPHTALGGSSPTARLHQYQLLCSTQGPLLRPDLPFAMTPVAGRGKDRQRRPATTDAQRPCGGLPPRSHSPKEGPLPDFLYNLRSNDSWLDQRLSASRSLFQPAGHGVC
jgi:Integrase core domain